MPVNAVAGNRGLFESTAYTFAGSAFGNLHITWVLRNILR